MYVVDSQVAALQRSPFKSGRVRCVRRRSSAKPVKASPVSIGSVCALYDRLIYYITRTRCELIVAAKKPVAKVPVASIEG